MKNHTIHSLVRGLAGQALLVALATSGVKAADGGDSLARSAAKLKEDGSLTIAYLGGSLTAGSGARQAGKNSWRAQVTQWFRDSFPSAEITEVNAAVGGTGSDFGAYRVGKDVISQKPDLVFVEFSVNDAGCERNKTDAVRPAMEGIVRQIWKANPRADIVFVYTTSKTYEPYHLADELWPAAQRHQDVADYYGIGSVNVGKALWQYMQEKSLEWAEILPDNVHPNDEGYLVYSKRMLEFLEAQDWDRVSNEAVILPAAMTKGRVIEETQMIAAVPYANADWVVTDQAVADFPQSLYADNPGAELRFEFTGNSFGLFVLTKEDSDDFEWSMDGDEFKRRTTWTKRGAQIGRPEIRMALNPLWVADEIPMKPHKVIIRLPKDRKGSGLSIGAFVINGTVQE